MRLPRRQFLRLAAAAAAVPALPRAVFAQSAASTWPNRVVRLIVGFPPGGGADSAARIAADRLSKIWGQQVVVENKGGAGGNIAHDTAAHAPPDGYTMLFSPSSLPIMPMLYTSLGYNPMTDFAMVSTLGRYPNLIVVSKESPLRFAAAVHRQRQGQSRQGDVRDARHRQHPASHRRTVQEDGRHRHDPRAVSRRGGRRDERSAQQPDRFDVQHHRLAASGGALRSGARACAIDAEALAAGAGAADLRRGRRAGLRRVVMVRAVRAGQDAAGDRQEDARRHREAARRAGDAARNTKTSASRPPAPPPTR